MKNVACLSVACLLLTSCSSWVDDPEPEQVDNRSEEVVGGQVESGYQAAGYMLAGTARDKLRAPYCGATLISQNLAVTAAHCVYGKDYSYFGVGFGKVDAWDYVPASAVVMHPDYDPTQSTRYLHDLAILVLEWPVTHITPAKIASAGTGCGFRSIGYGRTTTGNSSVTTGYDSTRKSATQCLTSVGSSSLFGSGSQGGLCWGDSGGALMRTGTNEIVGLLSDFNKKFDCQLNNSMIFTNLANHTSLRDCVEAHRGEFANSSGVVLTPSKTKAMCAQAPTTTTSCTYKCSSYGYSEGDCRDGWKCQSGCLKQATCPSQTCTYSCSAYNYTEGQCYSGWKCLSGCLKQATCS